MPGRPSSTISFQVSVGKRWFSSISAARGATFSFANSRTISWTMRCSSVRSKECLISGSSYFVCVPITITRVSRGSVQFHAPARGAPRAGRLLLAGERCGAAVLCRHDLAVEVVAPPVPDPVDQGLARELPLAADLAARQALGVQHLVEGLHAHPEQLGGLLDVEHLRQRFLAHDLTPSRAQRFFILALIHSAISSVGVPGPNSRA